MPLISDVVHDPGHLRRRSPPPPPVPGWHKATSSCHLYPLPSLAWIRLSGVSQVRRWPLFSHKTSRPCQRAGNFRAAPFHPCSKAEISHARPPTGVNLPRCGPTSREVAVYRQGAKPARRGCLFLTEGADPHSQSCNTASYCCHSSRVRSTGTTAGGSCPVPDGMRRGLHSESP